MILSVDTGLNNYGLSVFDKDSVLHYVHTIRTAKTKKRLVSDDMEDRINHINRTLIWVGKTYPITSIVGEMPCFGAQSSSAAVALTTGATIILSYCAYNDIKPTWATPREIKEYFTGDPNASKEMMMQKACDIYGWTITHKRVKDHKQPEGFRMDPIYHVMGKKYGKGYFEHIADAIGAYYATRKIKP